MADEEQQPLVGLQKKLQEKKQTRQLRRLKYSCEEVYERMDKGLCIFCDELDTPGHHDLKHKGIQIFMVDDDLASQTQETVTNPEPIVESANNSDPFIEPLERASVLQVLDSVPDVLMVHKVDSHVKEVEESSQQSTNGNDKIVAHQMFDQMSDEYQKDSTWIESSLYLFFSLKNARVWEPGGLPTKMDHWDWFEKELKPYGESHKAATFPYSQMQVVKSNPAEFKTFDRKRSNKTLPLEDEQDDEHEQNQVLKLISSWNNRIWEPGGVFIELDKWNWLGQCYNRGILMRLMHWLSSMWWKETKSREFHRLSECSWVDIKTWHFVKHETQQTDFHVWHRWKNKAEKLPADYALLEFMMLGLVSFQPNKGTGEVGTEEKLFDRLSLANYVWKPGELLCVQDQWDWISEVHNMGSVLKIMQWFHGLHLQGIINMNMRFREVIVHDVLSVKVCLSVCNRKFEAELEVYLLAHHNSRNQKIAGDLIYGDVNFHLKHKWRSRLLQTLSRLKFCVDDVILFTSSVKLLFFTKNHKLLHPETGFCTHYNGLEQLSTEFQGSLGLNYFTYLIFKWNQALNCGCEAGHISSGFSSVGDDVHEFFTCSKLQNGDETYGKKLRNVEDGVKQDKNRFYGDVRAKIFMALEELHLLNDEEKRDAHTLLMVYDAERLIQSDAPPIFSDLLCVKNRIQGRLKMVLLLEFLWLILFTSKMFKSSNVPQNKNQTDQKLSSYWKLLVSWKISQNIHVSSRCVLRQEESYVKVLELIKDRDSRKRKLCKNWWFKYKLNTWLSGALHHTGFVKIIRTFSSMINDTHWDKETWVKLNPKSCKGGSLLEFLKRHDARFDMIKVPNNTKFFNYLKFLVKSYILRIEDALKGFKFVKFTMEQSEKPLITILSYELFHSPRPPELSCCKEDEEPTAKISSLRTRMI